MKVDYIVVGSGLAGILFCEVLQQNNKSFVVFDDETQQSSIVAGGLYNPVILKRFTPVWKSNEQLDLALPMYHWLEKELGITLDYKLPVYRLFNSVEEQNNWFTASDKVGLSDFLSPEILQLRNNQVSDKYGVGEVLHTGRIDTELLILKYKEYLIKNQLLIQESFNYDNLDYNENNIHYNQIQAKYVVFAEGFGLKRNPFFSVLPLEGSKGELLKIYAPDLKLDVVLKASVFLIPKEKDHYIVGATYNKNDKSNKTTAEAREELVAKLNKVISCDYKIINQFAGVRPTVRDRRPLVGRHSEKENLFVLNGLGTRGVMIAPYVAYQLYNFIENDVPLDVEINIDRFQ